MSGKMEVIVSEKGRNLFLIEGFKFCFHKTLANEVERWMCYKKTCKSFLKINKQQEVLEGPTAHNHEKMDENQIVRNNLSHSLKRKASEDICAKPSKLIHLALKDADIESLTKTDLLRIKRNMHNAKSFKRKLPKSVEETLSTVASLEVKTNSDENFVFVNDSRNKMLGFSCKRNLEVLCRATNVYVDGTFKSCPKYFYQIFTFHALQQDSYVPLVFFLLCDKTAETYIKCFKYVVVECGRLGVSIFTTKYFCGFRESNPYCSAICFD